MSSYQNQFLILKGGASLWWLFGPNYAWAVKTGRLLEGCVQLYNVWVLAFYSLNCSWAMSKSANWMFLRFLFVEGGIQTEGWLANGIFGISTCSIVGFGSGFSIPKISWISLSGDFFGKSVSSRMSILLLVFDSSEFSFQLIDYVGAFFSKK